MPKPLCASFDRERIGFRLPGFVFVAYLPNRERGREPSLEVWLWRLGFGYDRRRAKGGAFWYLWS